MSIYDPLPETATAARIEAERTERLRQDELEWGIRERVIRTQQEAEDFAEAARQRKLDELAKTAQARRALMLDQLQESSLDFGIKSNWTRVLENDPTSGELARLQADVANYRRFRAGLGPLSFWPAKIQQDISFLTSFEAEVDALLALARDWDQTVS